MWYIVFYCIVISTFLYTWSFSLTSFGGKQVLTDCSQLQRLCQVTPQQHTRRSLFPHSTAWAVCRPSLFWKSILSFCSKISSLIMREVKALILSHLLPTHIQYPCEWSIAFLLICKRLLNPKRNHQCVKDNASHLATWHAYLFPHL